MIHLFKLKLPADKVIACLAGCAIISSFAFNSVSQANPITDENLNPGSTGWVLSPQTAATAATDKVGQIKGYLSATSVNKGGSIDFKITVNPVQNFTIEIYRVGWYGGNGGRLMTTIGPVSGVTQPACKRTGDTLAADNTTILVPGLLECNWSTSYTLKVPTTWTSGIYLAKLKNAAGFDSGAIFVVRDDNRIADYLYEQPVNTYQAYNQYPEGVGSSLYGGDLSGLPKAVSVSFNRPYAGYSTNYNGYGHFLEKEIQLVKWLEKQGYDVAYTTTVDTHVNGAQLLNYRGGILSAGHSEYWTSAERDAYENARNHKINLAFFGSNAIYWQVRFAPASDGTSNRTMICYKDTSSDPIQDPTLVTDHFRSTAVNRPEQTLMGSQYITNNNFWNPQAWTDLVVQNTNYWVYNGSGFKDGQSVPKIIGDEINTIQSSYAMPASSEFTILAQSPYIDNYNVAYNQQSVIYRAASASGAPLGWVFTAGTMVWSWALDYEASLSWEGLPFGVDLTNPGIQKITQNILDRFVNEPPQGLPVIVGTAAKHQTLSVNTSGISDFDGLGAFSYQWQRNGVNISGATGSTYTLSNPDVGAVIDVVVTYTDGKNNLTILTSKPTSAVLNVNDPPVGSVTISGTPQPGQTLTASNNLTDGDGIGTISYQWQSNSQNITGATGTSYVVAAGDIGKQISVIASYVDGHGTHEQVASSAVSIINILGTKKLKNLGSNQCAYVNPWFLWWYDLQITDGSCSNNSYAEWNVQIDASTKAYSLTNLGSGMYLTGKNGIAVQEWASKPATNQEWKVQVVDTNSYQIINLSSGLCLSEAPSSIFDWLNLLNGPNLVQTTCSNANSQKWSLN